DYEVRVLTRDGKTRRVVNLNVEIINYQGRMATIGTVKDITDRRMVEEQWKPIQRSGKCWATAAKSFKLWCSQS
ncbi:MAG: PAS domain S-box protein, partial [Euryarchaeota archaeon]|nr:PAS domain S-box protein [Euryarchaeota archaeon]MBU4340187.1 PAS domain S-box protein [Euryarchaeota archaeon]MBU4453625.1 PAS domain S-box protein [Euryarchaeota archaeon]